jgi:hypothetical protein
MKRFLVALFSIALFLALFHFSSTAYAQTAADLKPIEVKHEDHVFEVQAAMSGQGTIGAIQVFPEYGSIFITLNADPEIAEGELRIVLPRDLIDSKAEDGSDTEFLILVDGEDLGYDEISTTETERELLIPTLGESTEIEIFGSQVLPEFHIGFILLAAVAAISVVTITYQRVHNGRQQSPP